MSIVFLFFFLDRGIGRKFFFSFFLGGDLGFVKIICFVVFFFIIVCFMNRN